MIGTDVLIVMGVLALALRATTRRPPPGSVIGHPERLEPVARRGATDHAPRVRQRLGVPPGAVIGHPERVAAGGTSGRH